MTKKILVLAMALGMAFGMTAQDRTAIEKEAVQRRCTEFFNDINKAFAKHKKYDGPNWWNVRSNGKQFIVDDLAKFGVKATGIQKQFDALESDKKFNTQISRYDLGLNEAQSNYAEKNCYTTTHEAKVISNKGDVKCTVTNRIVITWMVDFSKYDTKKNDWKKGSFGEKGKAVAIISIETNPIALLTPEREMIAGNVNVAIRNWYKNINNNVNLRQANLDPNECVKPITFNQDLSNKTFVTKDDINTTDPITVGKRNSVPAFSVKSNNPQKHIAAGEELNYTNPEVSWNLQPTFTIAIDPETYEATITNVRYDQTIKNAETDAQKMAKLRDAANTAKSFGDKLNQYAQAPKGNEKNQLKNEILDMFANKKAKSIQFSLIKNNGDEMQKYIDNPTTPKSYLEHLPSCEFTMNYAKARFDETIDKVVIPYSQTYKQNYPENYKGTKYADKTSKALHLVYNNELGAWQIEQITAEKGSTQLMENE